MNCRATSDGSSTAGTVVGAVEVGAAVVSGTGSLVLSIAASAVVVVASATSSPSSSPLESTKPAAAPTTTRPATAASHGGGPAGQGRSRRRVAEHGDLGCARGPGAVERQRSVRGGGRDGELLRGLAHGGVEVGPEAEAVLGHGEVAQRPDHDGIGPVRVPASTAPSSLTRAPRGAAASSPGRGRGGRPPCPVRRPGGRRPCGCRAPRRRRSPR